MKGFPEKVSQITKQVAQVGGNLSTTATTSSYEGPKETITVPKQHMNIQKELASFGGLSIKPSTFVAHQKLVNHYQMGDCPFGGKQATLWKSPTNVTLVSTNEEQLNCKVTFHSLNSESTNWFKAEGDLIMVYSDGVGALHIQLYDAEKDQFRNKIISHNTMKDFLDTSLGMHPVDHRTRDRLAFIPKDTWVKIEAKGHAFFTMNTTPCPEEKPQPSKSILGDILFRTTFPGYEEKKNLEGRLGTSRWIDVTEPKPQRDYSVEELVAQYNMKPHDEVGFAAPYGSSKTFISVNNKQMTANNHILFLIPAGKADPVHAMTINEETWTVLQGRALVVQLQEKADGTTEFVKSIVGKDIEKGDRHAITMPANTFFYAIPLDDNPFFIAISTAPEFTPATFIPGMPNNIRDKLTPEQYQEIEPYLCPDGSDQVFAEGFTHLNQAFKEVLFDRLEAIRSSNTSSEKRLENYQTAIMESTPFLSHCGGILSLLPQPNDQTEKLVYLETGKIHATLHKLSKESGIDTTYTFLDGNPLRLHFLEPGKERVEIILSKNGDTATIPAGTWFASETIAPSDESKTPWALIAETISPPFQDDAFTLASDIKAELLAERPQDEAFIERLTHDEISFAYYEKRLQLNKHPEGGFFHRGYVSESIITDPRSHTDGNQIPVRSDITYGVTGKETSKFRRLTSDEKWTYAYGKPLELVIIPDNQKPGSIASPEIDTVIIGPDVNKHKISVVIPAGAWAAARVEKQDSSFKQLQSFSIVDISCTPGFHPNNFEAGTLTQLKKQYPHLKEEALTPFCFAETQQKVSSDQFNSSGIDIS